MGPFGFIASFIAAITKFPVAFCRVVNPTFTIAITQPIDGSYSTIRWNCWSLRALVLGWVGTVVRIHATGIILIPFHQSARSNTAITQIPSALCSIVLSIIATAIAEVRWYRNVACWWNNRSDGCIKAFIAIGTTIILLVPTSFLAALFATITKIIIAFGCIIGPIIAPSVAQAMR
jgi:hypothetical protein